METKQDKSFGVIPVHKNTNGDFLFCLIHQAEGHWTFPKGHQDTGETDEQTALRELKEEAGIATIHLLKDKFFFQNYSFEQNGIRYEKTVKYFIGFTDMLDGVTQENFTHEITALQWLTYAEAKEILTFSRAKELLDEVVDYLKKSNF